MAIAMARHELAPRQQETGTDMVDQWVRLGLAIAIIALISIGLCQFGARAGAIAPATPSITYAR
jgi:hypothetical protein